MAKATDHLRVPTHNLEAETSVLGSLMLDKDAVIKIADLLKVGDFYKDDHNVIYETMLALYEDREPIDVLSLANKLEEQSQLEKVGGSNYLASLVNSVPSASNVVHYAKVVQKKVLLRRLISAASDIVEMGYDESEDVQKILDEAEKKVFTVSQKNIKEDFNPINSILEIAGEKILLDIFLGNGKDFLFSFVKDFLDVFGFIIAHFDDIARGADEAAEPDFFLDHFGI